MPNKILITGGAGFIGSVVVRQYIEHTEATVINVDKLTYAGNLQIDPMTAHRPRTTGYWLLTTGN